jgi:hypothetical protein
MPGRDHMPDLECYGHLLPPNIPFNDGERWAGALSRRMK